MQRTDDNLSDGRPIAGKRARVGLDVDGGRRIVRANKGLRQALGRSLWRPRFVQRGEPAGSPVRGVSPMSVGGGMRSRLDGDIDPDLGVGKLSACKPGYRGQVVLWRDGLKRGAPEEICGVPVCGDPLRAAHFDAVLTPFERRLRRGK
jgi:hypothetical protein